MKDKKFNTPTVRFGIPNLTAKLPRFWNFRIPLFGGFYMGGGKFIIASFSTIALGFIAGLFLLISSGDQQITFPMLGASYEAPSMVGHTIVDVEFPAQRSQTLQLNIPQGTRLNEITFKNVDLGKVGLTNAFQLTGTSTTDMLTIDTMIIKNSEFPTMDWANGYIYKLNATSSVVVAGHTLSPTLASTTNDVVIGGGRGATSYVAEDMTVDRIIIRQTTTGGDVLIDQLTLDGVKAWTGAFDMDYFEIGTLIMENVRIGSDGDINSADFVVNTTVEINSIADGIVDEPVFIR
jgi:hypothetical protein